MRVVAEVRYEFVIAGASTPLSLVTAGERIAKDFFGDIPFVLEIHVTRGSSTSGLAVGVVDGQ